jgi:hypothetical protein
MNERIFVHLLEMPVSMVDMNCKRNLPYLIA